MSHPAANILRQAANANRDDARREGNLVTVEDNAEMIVSGDLHGNRSALAKVIQYASLSTDSPRRLVFQEVIHGDLDPRSGHDRSVEQLLRVARLKLAYPQQVLFLLGNHDLSQLTGSEISKDGLGVCKAFDEGVNFCFRDGGSDVRHAVGEFLASLPVAIRCGSTLLSHSLPHPSRMAGDWKSALTQEATDADLRRGGAIYDWVWGRKQTDEQIEQMAAEFGVEFFVIGHKHIDFGYEIISERALVITSEHGNGCLIHFPASVVLTNQNVSAYIKSIGRIGA